MSTSFRGGGERKSVCVSVCKYVQLKKYKELKLLRERSEFTGWGPEVFRGA